MQLRKHFIFQYNSNAHVRFLRIFCGLLEHQQVCFPYTVFNHNTDVDVGEIPSISHILALAPNIPDTDIKLYAYRSLERDDDSPSIVFVSKDFFMSMSLTYGEINQDLIYYYSAESMPADVLSEQSPLWKVLWFVSNRSFKHLDL